MNTCVNSAFDLVHVLQTRFTSSLRSVQTALLQAIGNTQEASKRASCREMCVNLNEDSWLPRRLSRGTAPAHPALKPNIITTSLSIFSNVLIFTAIETSPKYVHITY